MLPLAKIALALGVLVVGLVITTFPKGQKRVSESDKIQTCVENKSVERLLRENAQKALKDIGSTLKPSASTKRANRGQHVFNNGLLKFHRNVLDDLLKDVGGHDEQLENLMQDLIISLSRTHRTAISTMVAHFSSDEFYVDYNADVFGEFVNNLRKKLVQYLKAETSNNKADRYGIRRIREQVQSIATQMVNHEVYVDPMARDRWLQENPRDVQRYYQTRAALKIVFQNLLQDFQKVSDKIREFRRRNIWKWD